MEEQRNPVLDVLGWSGTIKIEVFDRPGGTRIQLVEEPMHSFVRNFYNLQVATLMGFWIPFGTPGDNDLSIERTDGNVVSHATKFPTMARSQNVNDGFLAAAGDDGKGILIGDSAVAFDFNQWFLENQVPDGTGAGQMSHIESNASNLTWSAGTRKWTSEMIRFFNNNSGGGITVRETVLVTEMGFWLPGGSDGQENVMMARDVIGAPPAVGDGGQLKVTYNLVSPAFPS